MFGTQRNQPAESQGRVTSIGLVVMTLGMGMLGAVSYLGMQEMLRTALIVFGGGFWSIYIWRFEPDGCDVAQQDGWNVLGAMDRLYFGV